MFSCIAFEYIIEYTCCVVVIMNYIKGIVIINNAYVGEMKTSQENVDHKFVTILK